MSIYDAVAARSLAAITKKGAAVTFPGTGTGGIYDPTTDTWSGAGSADVTGRAIQIPDDPARFTALNLVLTDPVTLMIGASGLSVTPAPGMLMTWAGVSYTIRDVEPVAPDGTPIIWTVIGSR